jgi:ubiquinol-cytochrome c reductase cytochrome b subunit
VFVIPALMFLLITTHLYLVIHLGISEVPTPGEPVDPATYEKRYQDLLEREGIPFYPDAVWKDVVFAIAVGVVVVLLAFLVGPPELGLPADPTIIQAYPRPDWYFLWYFALLALIPTTVENLFILGFPLTVGIIFLALPFVANKGERSPRRRPWAIAIVGLAALTIAVLVREGQIAPWSPAQNVPPLPASVTNGLSPAARQGAMVFERSGCSSCHAIAGVGGIKGPDLTYVGSRLSSAQITARILAGGNGMPAYAGNLSPTDTTNLVTFLEMRRQP